MEGHVLLGMPLRISTSPPSRVRGYLRTYRQNTHHVERGIAEISHLQHSRELVREIIEVVLDLTVLRETTRATFKMLDKPGYKLEVLLALWAPELVVIVYRLVKVPVKCVEGLEGLLRTQKTGIRLSVPRRLGCNVRLYCGGGRNWAGDALDGQIRDNLHRVHGSGDVVASELVAA